MWRRTMLTVLLSFAMIDAASAQYDQQKGTPRGAAEAALPALRRAAATAEAAQLLGFRSPEEAAQATLGEPLPIRFVRLDALQAYDATNDPRTILADGKRILFPLMAGSETRSGIEVAEKARGWDASAIGGARIAMLLDSARAAHRAANPGASYFAVHIAALNLYLLGFDTADEPMLIPIAEDARFPQLRPGVAVKASELLAGLVPAARAIDPKEST